MRIVAFLLAGAVVVGCCCDAPYPRAYILSEKSEHEGGAIPGGPEVEKVGALFLGDTSEEV